MEGLMKGLGKSGKAAKSNPKRKNGTTTEVASTSNSDHLVKLKPVTNGNVSVTTLIETMNRELDNSANPPAKKLKLNKKSLKEEVSESESEIEDDFDPSLYYELERKLCFKDIKNCMDDLKDFDRIFYLLKMYKLHELNKIIVENESRLKSNPNATPILPGTNTKLKRVDILFIMVSELAKKKIAHLNDYLLVNLMFNDRYQCPLYLKSKEATNDMRHRMSNFLSRCNKRKYGPDRVCSWLNDLIHDFQLIRAGLIKKSVNEIVEINDDEE